MEKNNNKGTATHIIFGSRVTHRHFAISTIALLMYSALSFAETGAEPGFNPAFIEQNGKDSSVADLSAFSKNAGTQLPGKYVVDISINDNLVDHQEIDFYADESGADKSATGLLPCLSLEQLKKYGIKTDAVPDLAKQEAADSNACVKFLQIIPSSTVNFDFNQQRLELSFPQAVLSNSVRGYVDPALWDNGIPALLLDYNFTGANTQNEYSGSNSRDDSYYLSLHNGFNLGAWRLRNYATWNDNNGEKKWQNVNTYLQRSLISLKSQLTLGDGYSSGDVFESVQYRGAQMASDDSMLPDSLQGFAPVVRGIAKSNAQVTISQNGYTIYQSYVSPGAFEITDLYPSSGSGDLTVEVKEEDGSLQKFVQPYSSVPILQREGRTKYSVTAGQFRSGYGGDNPDFGQVTLIHGFNSGMTLYGGLQGSDKYHSFAIGVGKNIGDWGAISVDVTQAKTQLPDESDSGQSYRFLYAKSFAGSGTDFRLLGYRYSTSGFYTLQESVDLNSADSDVDDFDFNSHKRSQIEGSINQSLPEGWGSFYFSASVQDYWQDSGKQQTLQWGYNNNWLGATYSITYSNNYTPDEPSDQQVAFNISIPLDRWVKGAWATYSVNHGSDGHVSQQAGVNGTLDDNKLNYSVSQGKDNQGGGNSGNANLDYTGSHGNSNLGYSYSKDSRRVNYGINGGMVLHSDGLTLSQPLGETIVLVAAPGAGGVGVVNTTGLNTDSSGYAVVPYTSAYRRNRIGLDTTTLGPNVEIEESAKDVIPTRGAVVRAGFNTHVGYRVMMTLTRQDGSAVPFGATASLSGKDNAAPDAGIVGEMGATYLSGLPEEGQLAVRWGKAPDQQCHVHYHLSTQDMNANLPVIIGSCLAIKG
ncbi:fimbria/pilus outer membrane usher protein [Buttiauxella gaviniae]|uniref:Fimbria/pilus outer membrane usher protein n=2 Tax=Buttiauxella gaviniae TaxID=82990 RepID=A0ABV3NY70_9ENTR